MNPAEEQVLISALNQYLYCPRRCALIHVEGVFNENAYTLEGRFGHEHADLPGYETKPSGRIVRGLPIFCRRLGLVGKADIVEFHRAEDGGETPYPVDYKRGPRRKWANDDAQLCAQALCLEEMTGRPVPAGAIFHAASKRRREVAFTPELRALTEDAVRKVRDMLASATVPPAAASPRCDGCSLRPMCLPEIVSNPAKVARYNAALYKAEP